MTELPDNINDAVGLIIQLKDYKDSTAHKDYDPTYDIANFGKDNKYVFILGNMTKWATDNERIRLYPIEEYPNGRVHLLGTMLGYKRLKDRFQVVGKIR